MNFFGEEAARKTVTTLVTPICTCKAQSKAIIKHPFTPLRDKSLFGRVKIMVRSAATESKFVRPYQI
jgi:hypothetical protein